MMKPMAAPNIGWIETKLNEEHIKFLWDRIKNRRKETYKHILAGNISGSYEITDKDNYFLKNVLSQHVEMYVDMAKKHPIREHAMGDLELALNGFWVNYQRQGEFNPYHHHGGIYSFTVWLDIPYDWKQQNKLEFLDGMKEEDKKAGIFEFEYTDILGGIRNFGYRLDKSLEGTMLFFPAALRHTVYPFYECDKQRISVAGNVWLVPRKEIDRGK